MLSGGRAVGHYRETGPPISPPSPPTHRCYRIPPETQRDPKRPPNGPPWRQRVCVKGSSRAYRHARGCTIEGDFCPQGFMGGYHYSSATKCSKVQQVLDLGLVEYAHKKEGGESTPPLHHKPALTLVKIKGYEK